MAISEFFGFLNNGLDIRILLLTAFMALLAGFFIWFTGRVIHKKRSFTAREEAGRVLLPVLTAFTVFCSSGSLGIAIAGAVLAAALVIRFKVAGENEREQTMFLLWGVAAGICIGERRYLAAAILCAIVFIVFLVFHLVRDDSTMRLLIRGGLEREMEAEGVVFRAFHRKALLKSKKADREGFELIYEISERRLRRAERERINITEMIQNIDGITLVQLTREAIENEG